MDAWSGPIPCKSFALKISGHIKPVHVTIYQPLPKLKRNGVE